MTWKIRITAILLLTAFGIFSAIYLRFYVNPRPHGIILFIAPGLSPEVLAMIQKDLPEEDRIFLEKMDSLSFVTSHLDQYDKPAPRELLSSLACGKPVPYGMVGLQPSGKHNETLMYDAQRARRLTGIISSTHLASPGGSAFFTHTRNSSNHLEVMQNAIDNSIINLLISRDTKLLKELKATHQRDLAAEFAAKGYHTPKNMDEFYNIMSWPQPNIFGVFDQEQSLPLLVTRSIQALQYNIGGYFLIVDHHAILRDLYLNKLASAKKQILELMHAIREAREYADEDATILVYCPYYLRSNTKLRHDSSSTLLDTHIEHNVTQTHGWIILDTKNDYPLPAFIDLRVVHKIISTQL